MRAELAEEASHLRRRLGFEGPAWPRAVLLYVLLAAVFGVLVPWHKGAAFLDSVILGAYASLGVVFAAPAAVPEFETIPSIQKALARVAVSVFYGELVAAVALVLGIVVVYVSHQGPLVVGPNLRSLADCALFGLALSVSMTMATMCISIKFSQGAAKGAIRLVFLGLLAAFYLRSGWLPEVALKGAGIALLVFILFLAALPSILSGRNQEA